MHTNRHACRQGLRLPVITIILLIVLSGCRVYTIDKSTLENELNPRDNEFRGLSLNAMYRKQFRNEMDTLQCADVATGTVKLKKVTHDSKITIITRRNKSIRFYAKTLYIYKNEFLIGERTAPRLRGPNYYPVKLSEISRIEVLGL